MIIKEKQHGKDQKYRHQDIISSWYPGYIEDKYRVNGKYQGE